MNSDWNTLRLADVLTLQYGKGLPERNRLQGDVPVYGSGGIVGYHNSSCVKGPGIVVGRKGSIGTVFYQRSDFYPIDTVFYADVKQNYDTRFVYYLLTQMRLSGLNSDAAIPGLNRNTAHEQTCKVPALETQRKIAAILSAYDDLIENNTRRIQILEDMARSLYREWFVQFRFPGHENVPLVESALGPVPEGWQWCKLGDRVELAYGKALKAENRMGGDVAVYGSSGIVGLHNEKLGAGPGIVVGRKGNVGSVFWTQTDYYPIDTAFYVKSDVSLYFLYYNLQHQNFLNNDAAVPGLSRNQAYLLPLLMPEKARLDDFEKLVKPIFDSVYNLASRNANLRKTRDLLLPRLISGELDVSGLGVAGGVEAG